LSILVIDNNDSFTYNLVQLIEECGFIDFRVIKNTGLDMDAVASFSKILISPGPGMPDETPNISEVINKYHKTKSILGVCLGHQAIAEYFGAEIINVPLPFHGIKSKVFIKDKDNHLFSGLHESFDAGRYHSWVVSEKNFPECLKITAVSDDGLIMAVSHKIYDVHGIQFHPESIMTPDGLQIIRNWLEKYPLEVSKSNDSHEVT